MTATIIDGKASAAKLREKIAAETARLASAHGLQPGLATVLVGHDPASEVYVGSKLKHGADVGFRADLERLPETATLADTLGLVERLNRDDVHDGILVQSPLALSSASARRATRSRATRSSTIRCSWRHAGSLPETSRSLRSIPAPATASSASTSRSATTR